MRTIYQATIELTARQLEAIKRLLRRDGPDPLSELYRADLALSLSVLRTVADKAFDPLAVPSLSEWTKEKMKLTTPDERSERVDKWITKKLTPPDPNKK